MAIPISSLALGDKIKFGTYNGKKIIWQLADKNFSGDINGQIHTPGNSYILVSYKRLAYVAAYGDLWFTGTSKAASAHYWLTSAMRQWLNSSASAGNWYAKSFAAQGTPIYSSWPGFLYEFTQSERSIMSSDNNGDKILMPWAGMAGNITYRGQDNRGIWFDETYNNIGLSGFANGSVSGSSQMETDAPGADNRNRYTDNQYGNDTAYMTQSCTRSRNNTKSGDFAELCYVNNSLALERCEINGLHVSGGGVPIAAAIRPVCYISNSARVSDTPDSDGCYTIVYNQAPPAPTTLNVPQNIYSGADNIISWSASIDPDGDAVSYQLERRIGSAASSWARIYTGSSRSYTDTGVPFGASAVWYRVRALDIYNEASDYKTSAEHSVISNRPPQILYDIIGNTVYGEDNTYSQGYKVIDEDGDTVTVTVKVDGKTKSSGAVSLNTDYYVTFTDAEWLKMKRGRHNVIITASDGKATDTAEFVFEKEIHKASFVTDAIPIAGSNRPERLSASVYWHFPENSTGYIYAANNGNDSEPTFENCTSEVMGHQIYTFTNTSKTADSWAIMMMCNLYNFSADAKYYQGDTSVSITVDGPTLMEFMTERLKDRRDAVRYGDWEGDTLTFTYAVYGTVWSTLLGYAGITYSGTGQSGDRIEIAVTFTDETPYFTMLSGATNSTE